MNKKELNYYYMLIIYIKREINKVIVGQEKIIDSILMGLISNGHLLIEGAPGLAKTVIVKTFSQVIGCKTNRVQFTPDLLPSDILGINMYNQELGEFHIEKGPIFTNLLLADEINRASSKVQSALLEAMAEREVTLGKETIKLSKPFLVFATENPIDNSGTYSLPQAQLDRFLFKLIIDYPKPEEEILIVSKSTESKNNNKINQILTNKDIINIQNLVKNIYVSQSLQKYIVTIVNATRNPKDFNLKLAPYIEWGAGPRGTIAIMLASKAKAFLSGRNYVIDQDIFDILHLVLRHRILLSYEGQAKKITTDHIVSEILNKVNID